MREQEREKLEAVALFFIISKTSNTSNQNMTELQKKAQSVGKC